MSNKISRHGFTIVELVIVIVIIAILAALTMFGFSEIKKKATDNEYKSKVTTIMAGLEKYYEKNGEYPSNVQLNPAKNIPTTDFAPLVSIIPGTSVSDFKASDGHSFLSYCSSDMTGCPSTTSTTWKDTYSKSFIYVSQFPNSMSSTGYSWLNIPASWTLGWGCGIQTYYDTPGFVLAWYSSDSKIWNFYRSKHGKIDIANFSGGPTAPGQTCTFSNP